jgi:hypothetical protein
MEKSEHLSISIWIMLWKNPKPTEKELKDWVKKAELIWKLANDR